MRFVVAWFDRLPFRLKLVFLAGASTVLALSFMALVTGILVWWTSAESARFQGVAMRPLLAAAFTGPMIERDYASVEEVARTLVSRDGIQEVTIRSPDGKVLAQVRTPEGVDDLLASTQTIVLQENGLRFGEVSLHFVAGPARTLLMALFWVVLACVPVAIALAFWVFKGWAARLTGGLEQLAHTTRALAGGDLSVRAHVLTRDEVGALAADFNRMAGDLQQQFEAIRQAENAQRQLAERDPLTGLFNRRAFEVELDRRLQQTAAHPSQWLALMYLDLDEFKELNDNLGHAAGDAMLICVASALRQQVPKEALFARLGGDEFGFIAWIENEQAALMLAEQVLQALRQTTLTLGGTSLRLTGSVGVAVAPMHGHNASDLASAADTAMYRAKAAGRNAARLYQPATHEEGLAKLDWNQRLYRALELNLFELRFQGIWRTQDGSLSHAEALLRLRDENNPDLIFTPIQFIAHAERSGIIREIDRWVFRSVVGLLVHQPTLCVAVNVSASTIKAGGFAAFAAEILRSFEVSPHRIVIEITETSALGDLTEARLFVADLRALGCKIALDDFGSGYASFAYLKQLQADLVKIDGQFVQDIDQHAENRIIVRAIAEAVQLSAGETVAEFVEDEVSARLIPSLGVSLVQGYWFDRPAPLAQFMSTVARRAQEDAYLLRPVSCPVESV
ncbi:MAG: putative bifunctional diguanylate cyclase/phosphodiesterase [Leptothrix ochracea]|uniref:putative bifunctional diguanylate cyclase/phosphodiesterase n=1 Tax=Leptothrix ochracea TaxID=735331 RepID=UPI0034E24A1A